MKKKGFTLIELIAVLVILSIIALIVTPLILNIINKVKEAANKRSVDAYGRAIELSIATYLLNNGNYPNSLEDLTIEYRGNKVVCNIMVMNNDYSIYLSECSVGGQKVKDNNTDDGYYHYGKTVIYQSYKIGDKISYNGINFYVIADSAENSDYVTLLKAEPLTVEEVNKYGSGHINKYAGSSVGVAADKDGYGYISYYTSTTCGYPNGPSGSVVTTGCTTDYNVSDAKYVVDNWSNEVLNQRDLAEDSLGYKVRLITYEDLASNLGYGPAGNTIYPSSNDEETPFWVSNYKYWTMSPKEDSSNYILEILGNNLGIIVGQDVYANDYNGGLVRPVIHLYKSAIN